MKLVCNKFTNSRRYCSGLSSLKVSYTSSKCASYIRALRDEWFIRSVFEYERVRKCGCVATFSLTYSEDNLPYYVDERFGISIPSFDKRHIKRFRDKLRVYLSRDGYDIPGIRYFVSSEYGGDTHRPHYHILLFFPFRVEYFALLDYVRKSWAYGFVGVSKNYGVFVNSCAGIRYASKYVSKCLAFYGVFVPQLSSFADLSDYMEWLKSNDLAKYEEFNRKRPFHSQSKSFGAYALDVYFRHDGVLDFERVSSLMDMSSFGCFDSRKILYSVPRYYFHKLLYTRTSDGLLVLNSDGLRYVEYVLPKRFKESYNSAIYLLSTFYSDERVNRLISCYFDFCKAASLDPYLLFSVYKLVYRDVVCSRFTSEMLQVEPLLDTAYDFLFHRLTYSPTVCSTAYVEFYPHECYEPVFNNLPFFAPCEVIIKALEFCNNRLSVLETAAMAAEEKIINSLSNLKDFCLWKSLV